jgi:hypothetical protein
MYQSPYVPAETPSSTKKSKAGRFFTTVGSGLAGLFAIWMVFAFTKGTTIFDLAACFGNGQKDTGSCALIWAERSVGFTVIPPGIGVGRIAAQKQYEAHGFQFTNNGTPEEWIGSKDKSLVKLLGPDANLREIQVEFVFPDGTTQEQVNAADTYLNAAIKMVSPNWVDQMLKWFSENAVTLRQNGEIKTNSPNKLEVIFTYSEFARSINMSVHRQASS